MPLLADDLEKAKAYAEQQKALRIAERNKQLKAEHATQKALQEMAQRMADKLGVPVGEITIHVCRRGRR